MVKGKVYSKTGSISKDNWLIGGKAKQDISISGIFQNSNNWLYNAVNMQKKKEYHDIHETFI